MSSCSRKVIEKQLTSENRICCYEKCDQYVFNECRSIKPRSLEICVEQTKSNWQIGFFDADGEVYFDKIEMDLSACFSSIIRNYWCNGKKGNEKKEGYYSLIKSVRKLKIEQKYVNDLINYVEGRYDVGTHWQLHKLNRNMKVKIHTELKETTVERLSKHFNNIYCDQITANLKIENKIICNCYQYDFSNCKKAIPQRLVINAIVEKKIHFHDIYNEVRIPEIVMGEKADLKGIIQNEYGYKCYSLLVHVQRLVIKNNPRVLCDLADYVNGRYKIYDDSWKLHKLNKNMKIMIEKPWTAFDAVKEIADCFVNVLVDNCQFEKYLAKQQSYQKQFQEYFVKYKLKINQNGSIIPASQEFQLKDGNFNIKYSNIQINRLQINLNIAPQQFICFHDTGKPVVIDKIVIQNGCDLRCVLQNAYYNGTDSGFFSLLQTVKEIDIRSDQSEDNQALVDLVDYIEGKYALNMNWKQKELDRNMRIIIDTGDFSLSLNVAQRLRKYFKNVSIDCIYTSLQTENVIDQKCEDQYIFINCRDVNPQKLAINAKLKSDWSQILFNNADDEVCIPEITIGEHGSFDAIVRNKWRNNKDDMKYGYYSLVSYVKTLTIQNNKEAVCDLDSYVSGNYMIQNNNWKVQKLSKNIIIRINSVRGLNDQINRLKKYFSYIFVGDKKCTGK